MKPVPIPHQNTVEVKIKDGVLHAEVMRWSIWIRLQYGTGQLTGDDPCHIDSEH